MKLCLTKQLLNVFKPWCEWGISNTCVDSLLPLFVTLCTRQNVVLGFKKLSDTFLFSGKLKIEQILQYSVVLLATFVVS